MYGHLRYKFEITMKTTHRLVFEMNEGIFYDTFQILLDGKCIETAYPGGFPIPKLKGDVLFDVDGRQLELYWQWSIWGDPLSIVVCYKDRILAQYGTDHALKNRPQ